MVIVIDIKGTRYDFGDCPLPRGRYQLWLCWLQAGLAPGGPSGSVRVAIITVLVSVLVASSTSGCSHEMTTSPSSSTSMTVTATVVSTRFSWAGVAGGPAGDGPNDYAVNVVTGLDIGCGCGRIGAR